jgi:hypothetical protein
MTKGKLKAYMEGRDVGVEATGQDLYRALGDYGGESIVGSKAIQEAGIPGIRYLDGDSRSAGQGSSNYVMFDDKNINITERGYAAPAALAGTAAATGAGMAMYGNEAQAFNSDSPNYQMPEYQQDNRLSEAVNRFSSFHQKRANKRGALDGMKQELHTLLQGVNTIANDVIFPAMDKPMQGYLGLGAAFSALAGGGSMEQAVGAGATAAQTPVDQTTYNMGGTVTDSLSPYVPAPVAAGAGALFNAGAVLGAP